MKQIILYLFAAITIVSAASCTKDEQSNINEQAGTRVIELTFDNGDGTKVGVSDRTPQWEAGDKVWLSNGTTSEEVTLKATDITDNVAKITTTLAGTLYAVYPASAQNGVSGGKIGFKIPASTDGLFSNAHISVAEGMTSLSFKNVVSIFSITTEDATKMVNISSNSYIAGEFKVTYSTLGIEAGTNQVKSVNITPSSAGDKYVAVASDVAFSAFEFTAIKTATNWAYKKSTSTTTTAVNTIYPIGEVSGWTYTTNGSLWAKFSVADSKKVRFSKGNLHTKRASSSSSDWTWGFYDHQYDCNSLNSGSERDFYSEDTEIDLFCWGYSETGSIDPTEVRESESSDNFKDWGKAIDDKGTWSTLGAGEWMHLIDRGDGDTFCKYGVSVCEKGNCLVIAPDGNTTSIASSYNDEEWATAEINGFVCLPAAGYRDEYEVCSVGEYGYYWSSSHHSNIFAKNCEFNGDDDSFTTNGNYTGNGYSVRLVTVAQ